MKETEQQEEQAGLDFRVLFSEDETRDFYQPEFQLPTRRIAFWSVGVSILLAGALVFSSLNEQNRPTLRPKAVFRHGKNSFLRPAKRSKADTATYRRQQPN